MGKKMFSVFLKQFISMEKLFLIFIPHHIQTLTQYIAYMNKGAKTIELLDENIGKHSFATFD